MKQIADYGDRLNEALSDAKVSRKSLAGKLGISAQAVGMVINGKSGAFSAENHSLAASYLGYEALWLATGKGEKKVSNRNLDNHLDLSPHELRLIDTFRSLPNDDERVIAIKTMQLRVNESSEMRDRSIPAQKEKKQASGR